MRNVRMTIWLVVTAITAAALTGMTSADSFEPDTDREGKKTDYNCEA